MQKNFLHTCGFSKGFADFWTRNIAALLTWELYLLKTESLIIIKRWKMTPRLEEFLDLWDFTMTMKLEKKRKNRSRSVNWMEKLKDLLEWETLSELNLNKFILIAPIKISYNLMLPLKKLPFWKKSKRKKIKCLKKMSKKMRILSLRKKKNCM